jgi:hypothetical protein
MNRAAVELAKRRDGFAVDARRPRAATEANTGRTRFAKPNNANGR